MRYASWTRYPRRPRYNKSASSPCVNFSRSSTSSSQSSLSPPTARGVHFATPAGSCVHRRDGAEPDGGGGGGARAGGDAELVAHRSAEVS